VNLVLTDIDTFTGNDFTRYEEVLREISDSIVARFQRETILPEVNTLTDRITLDQMNNCNAGIDSITLASDGNFYVCPGFYYDEKPVGDIDSGLCIKNSQLLMIDNAPVCSQCDAYQCKRCVWLNKKTTLEINTPSHEQCVVSHIERKVSRELLIRLKKYGFMTDSKIKRIGYLDPFEKYFENK
jgi:CXXX repeat peptide maturase